MGARLTLETSAARLVGRLSRAAGRGGGTTLPGKLLWKLDPAAIDALSARLPLGAAIVSATNGKTTTSAMAAGILGSRHRLAWNHSGANLASGIASTLVAERDAELGLLEVDEFALPEVDTPRSAARALLGNLFRDQLDRYGELEHIAERWRARSRAARDGRARRQRRRPAGGRLAPAATARSRFGVDDPRHARPALQHAADSKYCVRCGTPTSTPPPTSVIWATTAAQTAATRGPPLDVAARAVELDGLEASASISHPGGTRRVQLPLPGSTTSTTRSAAASLARALGAPLDEIVTGLERFSGRVRALRAHRRRRQGDPRAPGQEPGRRQRGGAHAGGGRRPAALWSR